jgi:hypothetical protein
VIESCRTDTKGSGKDEGHHLWWGQIETSTKRVSEISKQPIPQRAMKSQQGTSFLSASVQLKVGVGRLATSSFRLNKQSQASDLVN